jgi:alkanesulfonate monooxygenase SsuD/methylene tetrahydromethanopterin reductase-like flavin-dependent oxidoreductase (luciferase family)/predicted kinase
VTPLLRDGGQTRGMESPLPDPAVFVLIGASGSGKSTWASERFGPTEIVSSDALRAVVGSGPADLDASTDAFALLDTILANRLKRRLTTVVDTLGLDRTRRLAYLTGGHQAGLPVVAVLLRAPEPLCRARNAARDRPVPLAVLRQQIRAVREVENHLPDEGFDQVIVAESSADSLASAGPADSPHPAHVLSPTVNSVVSARAGGKPSAQGFEVILQVSRFPWGEDPLGWLTGVARRAYELGFSGLALMDHLIQIPQVGRAWEPIPEPWVALGFVAGLGLPLRLGTLVSPVTFRPPGITAKAAATLDTLSGGRAFCGLGAGWWAREHEAYGLPFPPNGERLDVLERAIETIRALWASGTKAYAGSRVNLPETTCYPRPVGPVPIIVGGSGERRTLRIAAALADGCNLPSDLAVLDHKIAVLHRHCADVGRDPADVAITVLDLPVIGVNRGDVARRVERLRGRTPAANFAARHHAGTAEHHARRYHDLAERGVSTVFLALPDLLTPDDLDRCSALIPR